MKFNHPSQFDEFENIINDMNIALNFFCLPSLHSFDLKCLHYNQSYNYHVANFYHSKVINVKHVIQENVFVFKSGRLYDHDSSELAILLKNSDFFDYEKIYSVILSYVSEQYIFTADLKYLNFTYTQNFNIKNEIIKQFVLHLKENDKFIKDEDKKYLYSFLKEKYYNQSKHIYTIRFLITDYNIIREESDDKINIDLSSLSLLFFCEYDLRSTCFPKDVKLGDKFTLTYFA